MNDTTQTQTPTQTDLYEKTAQWFDKMEAFEAGQGNAVSACYGLAAKCIRRVPELEHSVWQEHNAFMLAVEWSGENDADMLSIHREIVAQKDSEIERLQKLLDERDGALRAQDDRELTAAQQAGIIYVGCDTPDALAEAVTSLRRELAEAREIERKIEMLREEHWTIHSFKLIIHSFGAHKWKLDLLGDGSRIESVEVLASEFSEGLNLALSEAIRSLKPQPNQTNHA